MNRFLFICTSNKDRSPALVNYFKATVPTPNEYRSAGINKYFCNQNGTHLIKWEDIKWCDTLVFCESVHYTVIRDMFAADHVKLFNGEDCGIISFLDGSVKNFVILNCGNYVRGPIGEDYLTKAEIKLWKSMIYFS